MNTNHEFVKVIDAKSWHYRLYSYLLDFYGMRVRRQVSLCRYFHTILWLSLVSPIVMPVICLLVWFLKKLNGFDRLRHIEIETPKTFSAIGNASKSFGNVFKKMVDPFKRIVYPFRRVANFLQQTMGGRTIFALVFCGILATFASPATGSMFANFSYMVWLGIVHIFSFISNQYENILIVGLGAGAIVFGLMSVVIFDKVNKKMNDLSERTVQGFYDLRMACFHKNIYKRYKNDTIIKCKCGQNAKIHNRFGVYESLCHNCGSCFEIFNLSKYRSLNKPQKSNKSNLIKVVLFNKPTIVKKASTVEVICSTIQIMIRQIGSIILFPFVKIKSKTCPMLTVLNTEEGEDVEENDYSYRDFP